MHVGTKLTDQGFIEGSEALEDFGKIKGQSMTSLDRQFFKQTFSAAFQPT